MLENTNGLENSLAANGVNNIVDFTNDGNCSHCGECCGRFIPVSKKEIEQIKRYVKNNGIEPYRQKIPYSNYVNMNCPFLDLSKKDHKCMIYSVRPEICKCFKCNNPATVYRNKKMFSGNYKPVDMWESVFGIKDTIDIKSVVSAVMRMKKNDSLRGCY